MPRLIRSAWGGSIINVDKMKGSFSVDKKGVVCGAGELTEFDRTGNTYGMEAWVYVGDEASVAADKVFTRPVAAP